MTNRQAEARKAGKDTGGKEEGGEGKGFPWFLIVLAVAMLAVLISLGNWQVRRLHWKENLLATIEARIHSEPLPIGDVVGSAEGELEYTPVSVTGRFDHEGTSYFFATHHGASGWYVYTPLEITEGDLAGQTLLVNRGFVPYDLRDPASRPGSEPDGEVTVEGLARERLAAKPIMAPDNKPAERTFFWKDWDAMEEAAGLDAEGTVPFFVDAGFPDREYSPQNLPQPGVTLIALPNSHLQYAVTWYGLALALAGVTGVFLWRRWRGTPSA